MTFDQFLYGVFPYVCVAVAIVATFWRFVTDKFSYSSLSSQFLENQQLFWGSVAWHYGILIVLGAHLLGFLIPDSILWWNSVPVRLYFLEITGFVFGLLALVGLVILAHRRFTSPRIRVMTSPMDIVLYASLLLQIVVGVWLAMTLRWGSSWYASFAVPYLWSLLELKPNVALVNNLPMIVQIHIVNAFVLILLIPFTRLVHFLSFPYKYLFRPHQVVRWNRRAPIIGPSAR
jgi:nitrate reductase gamma subunit